MPLRNRGVIEMFPQMFARRETAATGRSPWDGLKGFAVTDAGAQRTLPDCWNFADPWYYIQPQCDSNASNTCVTAGLWENRLTLWPRLDLECEEPFRREQKFARSPAVTFYLFLSSKKKKLTYLFSAALAGIVMLPRERSKQPEPDCAVTFLVCVWLVSIHA